jgi:hypothetical protein
MRSGMLGSLSGNLASWAGVPYAIAAKFAHPDRPVFALVGDGAFQMNGMNEMLTIAKYHERWSDPRLNSERWRATPSSRPQSPQATRREAPWSASRCGRRCMSS